jgi:hypothetical protein
MVLLDAKPMSWFARVHGHLQAIEPLEHAACAKKIKSWTPIKLLKALLESVMGDTT